jgi:hypothetical protein
VNKKEVGEFEELPVVFGYFLISFENGVGNIYPPTYEKPGNTFLDKAILHVIYLIWILN